MSDFWDELRDVAGDGWDNSPTCPICGSFRYVETTKTEECEDCGHFYVYP
jgi:hypothetical protein